MRLHVGRPGILITSHVTTVDQMILLVRKTLEGRGRGWVYNRLCYYAAQPGVAEVVISSRKHMWQGSGSWSILSSKFRRYTSTTWALWARITY